jgi:ABC-type nitrate/sulfonate/bicarbonate transport system permease component
MRWLWRCVAGVAGVGGWQLWASSTKSSFFPPPSAIVSRMYHLWFSGPAAHLFLTPDATSNILPSLGRVLAGLAIATAIAFPLGIALGRSPVVTSYLSPLLQFARALPVATIVFGTIWPILLNTIDGAATVDPQHLETGRAFRLSAWQRLIWVIIPAALPKAFAGFRLSLSLSLILMVFAELVGSSNGIGYEMSNATNSFDMTFLWSTIVLLGILGYLLNALLGGAERLVLSWHTGKGQD